MVAFSVSTRARRGVGVLLVAALLGGGCAPLARPPAAGLRPLAVAPRLLDDGDRAPLAAAVAESLRYFERIPPDRPMRFGTTTRTTGEMRAALGELAAVLAAAPSAEALAAEVGRRFEVYRATAPDGVLFTGYYLPTLAARRTPDARFRTAVLGRPADLVTVALGNLGAPCGCRELLAGRVVSGALVPYFTRAEIEAGAGNPPPIAWVDDPVGLFFLQIQGSGVLVFPDGSARTIGFAASNGRPYVSVGRLLVERGELALAEATMAGIRAWVAAHPEEGRRLFQANERYVFFRELAGPPVGSLGVPVTAGRTIATDPAVFPPGALAFIDVPATGASPALSRFVLNQDTGAAIRGPGRVDVYFGASADAATIAGGLRSPGTLYFLVPLPRTASSYRARRPAEPLRSRG